MSARLFRSHGHSESDSDLGTGAEAPQARPRPRPPSCHPGLSEVDRKAILACRKSLPQLQAAGPPPLTRPTVDEQAIASVVQSWTTLAIACSSTVGRISWGLRPPCSYGELFLQRRKLGEERLAVGFAQARVPGGGAQPQTRCGAWAPVPRSLSLSLWLWLRKRGADAEGRVAADAPEFGRPFAADGCDSALATVAAGAGARSSAPDVEDAVDDALLFLVALLQQRQARFRLVDR